MNVGPWQYSVGGLGLLSAALAGLLFVQSARLDRCDDARRTLNAAIKEHERNDLVQEKSIADLRAVIDRDNAETDRRAASLKAQQEQYAKALADVDKRAAESIRQQQALEALARGKGGICAAPREVMEALRGL
ncbi:MULTISPECIES: hypothetical protein [unclassified Sphingobium]|uniref:hypothetical protein n=1 Tax=unclassified Sphingobium TaxID=2611147 RepID=UPI002224A746|nr:MULTISPECIES: hypothetical protein [unclassified Sphingobium]MCW2395906.1 vacuolar-type H+-ATPase subunit I/STV1 [Sphingobium sp. B8D3B]MCW2419422.1 vacuolar-type H+-ATPase subunit I/STV1 [Sphingobium sp. B8D3C]